MKATTKKIAGISITIWFTALLINTVLGLYVASGKVKASLPNLALKGILYGAIFSFPVFLIVWILLYFMHKGKLSAGNIFLILLVIAGGLTLGVFILFSEYMKLLATLNLPLMTCAMIASGISIALQYGSLKKVCFRRDHPGHFPRE
jgi:disulfide bond formation protein DsbB